MFPKYMTLLHRIHIPRGSNTVGCSREGVSTGVLSLSWSLGSLYGKKVNYLTNMGSNLNANIKPVLGIMCPT